MIAIYIKEDNSFNTFNTSLSLHKNVALMTKTKKSTLFRKLWRKKLLFVKKWKWCQICFWEIRFHKFNFFIRLFFFWSITLCNTLSMFIYFDRASRQKKNVDFGASKVGEKCYVLTNLNKNLNKKLLIYKFELKLLLNNWKLCP